MHKMSKIHTTQLLKIPDSPKKWQCHLRFRDVRLFLYLYACMCVCISVIILNVYCLFYGRLKLAEEIKH